MTLGKFSKILHVAVNTPIKHGFDYVLPNDLIDKFSSLKQGVRIKVPFGRKETIGFLLEVKKGTDVDIKKLKPITSILDEVPLISEKLVHFIRSISTYYHHSVGEVFSSVFPKFLRENKDISSYNYSLVNNRTYFEKNCLKLNEEQQIAVEFINKNSQSFKTFLLDGVTGSGKTEVYLRIIKNVIDSGKQVLVLVPEIGLIPQITNRIKSRFKSIGISLFHSKLTDREKLVNWIMAKNGSASVVVGTRSAIFAQMRVGAIIVDEEHDSSYKQQSKLLYWARDLAVLRGKLENIPVILGSATPSLESLFNVKQKKYTLLKLSKRAGESSSPCLNILDMRNQKIDEGLSHSLIKEINLHLSENGQVLLFLNRRGYAPVLLCHNCGWSLKCKRCDSHMILHKDPDYLRCPHCDRKEDMYKVCPECGKSEIISVGIGTQKIELALRSLFPDKSIVRIDRDSIQKKDSMNKMMKDVYDNKYDILIGTQILAKGHHFPNITMSAIIDMDNSMLSSDFRAFEHMGQLIIQVAGRAGRVQRQGNVFIQTHFPNHPLIQTLIRDGYNSFADKILEERKLANLPPFFHSVLIKSESKNKDFAIGFLKEIKQLTHRLMKKDTKKGNIEVLGPVFAPIQRKVGFYRTQLFINSALRKELHVLLNLLDPYIKDIKLSKKTKWVIDVDPIDVF